MNRILGLLNLVMEKKILFPHSLAELGISFDYEFQQKFTVPLAIPETLSSLESQLFSYHRIVVSIFSAHCFFVLP